MFKPSSTYRIQFNKDFTFKSLDKIIPYLQKLGIDTLYASPIFEAVEGSMHGYDVTNPYRINPEIGTEEELFTVAKKLKDIGINWLQDIVPNHMAFSPKNNWLMDVLKEGINSKYATFFDIDLSNNQKLMVPFLGADLDQVIEAGELKVASVDGKYFLRYGDSDWPVNTTSQQELEKKTKEQIEDKDFVKDIANQQFYRLCNWQETNRSINFRRFFTVNSLICLNIQKLENFEVYHRYILSLVKKGIFQGLRIDHIDGLYDPKKYLDRLREAVGDEVYIVVEKILEKDEQVPSDWAVQGNTGYDFLAMTNNLFTNQANKERFDKIYQDVTGKSLDPDILIEEKKTSFLFEYMQGELNNLFSLFIELKLIPDEEIKSVGTTQLKRGIAQMLIQMPVYRYYNYNFPLPPADEENLKALLSSIAKKKELDNVASLLQKLFIEIPRKASQDQNENLSRFYQRLMQFSGPLMAKGVEDTVMFTYNRFIGHTEVGDTPDAFGFSIDDFHEKMTNRQVNWPLSLNGSATHDTKKGEDFRARINVLTDLPDEWSNTVNEFISSVQQSEKLNKLFKSVHNNDSYLILQTILGVLPFPGQDFDDLDSRLKLFIEKALREAKKRSDWAEPNEEYEQLVQQFALQLINKEEKSFVVINKFLNRIADFGIVNSLAQTVLKFTCPGVPDIYQGTELWDLSLVDPDNRRPVDYEKRMELISEDAAFKTLWENRSSGSVKLWLTRQLIKVRKANQEVFTLGNYIPLKVTGSYKSNLFAFARVYKDQCFVVAVPIGLAAITKNLTDFDWLDTQVEFPNKFPTSWKNHLTSKEDVKDTLYKGVLANQLLGDLPIGLIELKKKRLERAAGILMHITSLPSQHGIGDFGEEATSFVDFLVDTNQQYWQLLPLNPTKKGNGHSPYSSNSAKAGNVLLIDLMQLAKDGLIAPQNLELSVSEFTGQIDFASVENLKFGALQQAYKSFKMNQPPILVDEFKAFCDVESEWLNDFALYTAIKNHHQQLEWYNWPEKFRKRDQKAINDFNIRFADEINEVKWQQYIFFKQWHKLKDYANENGVKIIGDLPFYLDYDSVEVWSNPTFFKLDEDLKPIHVAGVPPDYFNENGQLWGMPIYNWSLMRDDNYEWWIKRLKKNMEMFDLLRLDHFIAFSTYWQIPAADENAINGEWKKGVGHDFFKIIQREFPLMPFIAEDLGEISAEVETLRDEFRLPGMKVLQFAFGNDVPISTHIPHNFENQNCIVYSGTHDNNTLLGWYENETNEATKKRIDTYFGRQVDIERINLDFVQLAYSSTAKIAIAPIQDLLGLGEEARMNIPGNANGNWLWRVDKTKLSEIKDWLKSLTEIYGRAK